MRPEKQLLLNELQEKIQGAPSFLVARYQKLSAERAHNLRTAVRNSGGDFEVVKKRVLVKAAAAVNVELEVDRLEGHIGIVLAGEDPLGTTKVVYSFGKDNEDAIDVLLGNIDGVLYGDKEMQKLSKLPSQDEMRAQFLGLLAAPMQETLGTMEALLTSVLYCMENKAKQEGKE